MQLLPSSDPVVLSTPLSSDRAFDALARFSLFHGHNYHGSTAKFPFPTPFNTSKSTVQPDDAPLTWKSLKEELPYYMTLSCGQETIISWVILGTWSPLQPCQSLAASSAS
ncbi:hypothetical protein ASPZODRAFT_337579 [Penicilliopsis zonata CBS 506.65]|uniref:Uncharacterized protein n=1 Tax=Penicilliopsis zonata CBS 506.65 TaxID=1073090 RepID=A0A1L9SVG7_9EURO|nr:hypothetical protein ASPZODRAFT_337579 [Penicilliopsis zonata CBS 506.65]OJJ51205.1 hypothetical protein ASPZODRAFT_337579 [Penicilliopsis zonata CBS 506.65]